MSAPQIQKDYIAAWQKYLQDNATGAPTRPADAYYTQSGDYVPQADPAQVAAYADWENQQWNKFRASLPQDVTQAYDASHQQSVDANKRKANTGAVIALGAPLAAWGAGAALGAGGLGTGGLGAAAGDTAAAWGSGSGLGMDTLSAMGVTEGGLGGALGAAGGAAAGGGGGLLGTLGTLGSAAGGLSKLGGAIGAIGGGLLGANQKAPTDTTTRQIDPRMAAYLYGADGTSGILGGVNDLWKKQMAQGGLNDVQREGLNRQLATLRDPRYSQGFDAMRSSGLGLLGMPIAGNPYTQRG